MAKEIERVSLLDISPPSITGDQNVKHLITAIDPELLSVSQDIREAFIISRINELPEEVLDLLAWQWHVDFYELAHSVEAKREMVLKSIAWHRKKGTSRAILDALAMIGVEAKFTSWQHEGADPYTFAIDAKLTGDFWERVDWTKPTQTIRRAIQESKAARSWMSRLYVYMETQAQHDITIGTAIAQGLHHELPFVPETHSTDAQALTFGTAIGQIQQHDIPIVLGSQDDTGLDIAAGTAIVQGKYHELGFVPETQSADNQPLTVGAAIGQRISHTVPIEQTTSSEGTSAIGSGTAIIQGIHHEIDIEQSTNTQVDAPLYAGCLLACCIHVELKMAA